MAAGGNVLANKNFRLLFIGESVSYIGDQFTLIAIAWLVIIISGNPAVLGTVLAVAGVPRAILMLVGGVIIDRFSPKIVMQVSNAFRLVFVSILSAMAFSGHPSLWLVYVISFLFGVADAFYLPAQVAVAPSLVEKSQLQVANTFLQGAAQLSQFVGPIIAGFLIGYFQRHGNVKTGLGLAFLIDALTFVVSQVTLIGIHLRRNLTMQAENMLGSIKTGLAFAWKNIGLRYILISALTINFLLVGPFFIGIPLICSHLSGGATAYGIIFAFYGGGVLAGYLSVGVLTKFYKNYVAILTGGVIIIGASLAGMGFTDSVPLLAALSFLAGAASGIVSLLIITDIQQNTPDKMMGRMMSILMLSSVGLIPVSEAAAGGFFRLSIRWVFFAAGVAMCLFVLYVFSIAEVRRFARAIDMNNANNGELSST